MFSHWGNQAASKRKMAVDAIKIMLGKDNEFHFKQFKVSKYKKHNGQSFRTTFKWPSCYDAG